MKTLKESILNRSSHGEEGFKTQRREMIEKWLNEYNVKNYTVNDDFTIDVDEDVNLFKRDLKEFPEYIQFGVIKGFFDCSHCHLKSLRGAPRIVEKSFDCSNNELTSLEGVPEKIGGGFLCYSNKLTTLKGAPKEVRGRFYCGDNSVQFTDNDVRKVCDVRGTIYK